MNTTTNANHIGEQNPSAQSNVDTWLKISIPIVLALLAAVMNASAIHRQMQTQPYLAFKENLPIGHVVSESDFISIELGGQTANLTVTATNNPDKSHWVGRILGRNSYQGELVREEHFGGVELGTNAEETLLLSEQQIGSSEASLLRPGQWVYFTCYPKGSTTAAETHIGPFRVAAFDKARKTNNQGGVLLIYSANEKGRKERRRLVEILDNNDYRVSTTIMSQKPTERLASATQK